MKIFLSWKLPTLRFSSSLWSLCRWDACYKTHCLGDQIYVFKHEHFTWILQSTRDHWEIGDWMFVGKSSQLGKHSFSSVLNLIWACCHSEHPPPILTSLYKWSFPNYSSWKFMTVKVLSFTETFGLPYQFYFAIPFHGMFDEYIIRD